LDTLKVPVPLRLSVLLLLGALLVSASGCSFRRVVRHSDIPYQAIDPATRTPEQSLNVFAPRNQQELHPVLVFIHGGSWNSGRKEQYKFLGRNWARKGVVTVIIDYPLSPQATYHQMAGSAARAVQWVQQHIREYGGNPDRIFLSGHSAGGHLASLISLNNAYFDSLGMANPVKGTILIDAAGLDMYGYLLEEKFTSGHTYLNTFTSDPERWKDASPIFHLRRGMPPMLIYRGGKTYPSIEKSTEKFVSALRAYEPNPRYTIQKGRRHIPMILQYIFPWNPRYAEIRRFMEE
jgi:acetyl esterase/lipase